MKQTFAFLMIGMAGLAASFAMTFGEPARADIAVAHAATQPLPAALPDISVDMRDSFVLLGLED
ncbi:hypothetical protein ACO2Q9_05205 [Variovorax sp. VNK109]|jgi:hypothetical protein|uniref:hypothetical protein n=1 Tax=Variovorax sp. VNK109 TaxID=3400919 RepID=UPI003C0C4C8A